MATTIRWAARSGAHNCVAGTEPLGVRPITGTAANRAAYERVLAEGGTLYPVSAFPMSRKDWRSHFGSAFRQAARRQTTYDPSNVLTPGYDVFGHMQGVALDELAAAPGVEGTRAEWDVLSAMNSALIEQRMAAPVRHLLLPPAS